jgi:hypothetical protein
MLIKMSALNNYLRILGRAKSERLVSEDRLWLGT